MVTRGNHLAVRFGGIITYLFGDNRSFHLMDLAWCAALSSGVA